MMKKTIKILLVAAVLILTFLVAMLTFFLVIPFGTTASDEIGVVIENRTASTMSIITLENTGNDTYAIVDSVRKPLLFAVIHLLSGNQSMTIRYDAWGTNETLYLLGKNIDGETYFSVSTPETREIIFDPLMQSAEFLGEINTSYSLARFHVFLALYFYLAWILLKKYFIQPFFTLTSTKILLLSLAGINLIYAAGYFVLITFIKIYF
ncbi:hypothetical protein COT83_04955 [Candidatus Peregrinibacteria bacterium CG10_big_fil_rev_8_21_14_0_10_44_7]|nr:MAG: hypothetical protein COT83_04955 [Candidatus Peregrinibacteria bacterium CG10_big_fil_rev_8_21_14_0_10_44_7]PJB89185.1 MAG: hypothetical protein CO082_01890 [Candidatus Peregrinibacteria bacterium CG_4_9_14_0_8_um_filter_44_15]